MEIICRNKSAIGGGFAAILPTGEVMAGDTQQTARSFGSAREAYDYFRDRVEWSNTAWNICYMLEDHLPKAD